MDEQIIIKQFSVLIFNMVNDLSIYHCIAKYSQTQWLKTIVTKRIKKMWYLYMLEYYSAIKKNEILPFASTWMDLEIIILSEISQTERQMPHDITYMWNLKYDTNELIYKTETDPQTQRTDEDGSQEEGGVGEGWIGSLGLADTMLYIAYIYIYRMDKQQSPTVQHRELYSTSCDKP